MKRLIATIITIFCLVAAPMSCFAETTTIKFRGYDWGTSFDEVMEKEITSDPSLVKDKDYGVSEGSIGKYYSDVAGYEMWGFYSFNSENKLYEGSYLLDETHSNETQYYYDFKDLADKFTTLYGEPSDKREIWYDDLYKDKPSDWGMSFATGRSKFAYTWEDKIGNSIGLLITGDNYEITVAIFYNSGELAEENTVNTNGL